MKTASLLSSTTLVLALSYSGVASAQILHGASSAAVNSVGHNATVNHANSLLSSATNAKTAASTSAINSCGCANPTPTTVNSASNTTQNWTHNSGNNTSNTMNNYSQQIRNENGIITINATYTNQNGKNVDDASTISRNSDGSITRNILSQFANGSRDYQQETLTKNPNGTYNVTGSATINWGNTLQYYTVKPIAQQNVVISNPYATLQGSSALANSNSTSNVSAVSTPTSTAVNSTWHSNNGVPPNGKVYINNGYSTSTSSSSSNSANYTGAPGWSHNNGRAFDEDYVYNSYVINNYTGAN